MKTREERISRIYIIIDKLYKQIEYLRSNVKINDDAYKVVGVDSLGSKAGKPARVGSRKTVKVILVEKI